MYGPGITQPQPRPAGRTAVVWLRVLLTAVPILSLGFFAWGSMLRLALLRKNPLDWTLMVIDVVLVIAGYLMLGMAPDTDSWQANVGAISVLVVMFGTPVYYLVADLRFRPGPPAGYGIPTGPYAYMTPGPYTTGYGPVGGGIPGPGPMPAQAPAPTSHPMAGQTPVPHQTPVPPQAAAPEQTSMPATGPAAAQPQAPRIDQVRAELDELSDYLRKEEGQ